ncbi:MAG TPA: hypothetical protein VFM57_07220 [Thermoleophilaceae bacterium]|nr:hypothetical protein [Thermoleophilaceae bacterium]
MTRVVDWIWGYESRPTPFLHVRRSKARPVVISVRVSRRDPRYALAAAELRTPAGRLVAWGTTLVLLHRVQPAAGIVAHDPWSYVWDGTRIPDACTAATPQAVRDLVCPNPWATLGLRPPTLDLRWKLTLHVPGDNLRRIAWKHVTVPGAVCGSAAPIRLGRSRVLGPGGAVVLSRLWPWWARIEVAGGGPAAYGDVTGDGKDEAALIVNCANGGGTADGQLAFAAVIYTASANSVRVVGIVTPRQPFLPSTPHVPLLQVTLRRGEVISHEFWYGASDGTCCSSGRATTVWHYRRGTLAPGRTVVTRKPR